MDAERKATIEAGRKAGLNVIGIINEPTAAVFAYGINERPGEQTILIYDLGGGTFDVTIAKVDKDQIQVLGSDGNHELGGKDWDDGIARYLAAEFEALHGVNPAADPSFMSSLLVIAEKTKKILTSRDKATATIYFGGKRADIELTGELFDEITEYLLGATKDLTENLIESLGLSWNKIDGVILVGGSTRMKMISKYVRAMSGKEPLSGVNVDEAVALGAAIRANIDDKGRAVMSIGGKTGAGPSPAMRVSGAKAVTDVTAHSMGAISVSADGNSFVNSIIIKKNNPIPASSSRPFKLRTRRGENETEVYVLQGEQERPLDNTIVNKYVISGIEATASREAVVDIRYQYTSDGVIKVSAVQRETGKDLPIRIEPVPDDMRWTDGSPGDLKGSAPIVEIFLAVDLSGSMCGEPLKQARRAMTDFVGRFGEGSVRIGVIGFADSVACILEPSGDFTKVKRAIKSFNGSMAGYGNDAEPFTEALNTWVKREKSGAIDVKYLVVLTDGVWSYPAAAITAAKICHKTDIEVIALGFGSADRDFLRKIASKEDMASLTNLSDLGGSFSKIAQAIGSGTGGMALIK
jgi:Mg-chelatase subunit ChlD